MTPASVGGFFTTEPPRKLLRVTFWHTSLVCFKNLSLEKIPGSGESRYTLDKYFQTALHKRVHKFIHPHQHKAGDQSVKYFIFLTNEPPRCFICINFCWGSTSARILLAMYFSFLWTTRWVLCSFFDQMVGLVLFCIQAPHKFHKLTMLCHFCDNSLLA